MFKIDIKLRKINSYILLLAGFRIRCFSSNILEHHMFNIFYSICGLSQCLCHEYYQVTIKLVLCFELERLLHETWMSFPKKLTYYFCIQLPIKVDIYEEKNKIILTRRYQLYCRITVYTFPHKSLYSYLNNLDQKRNIAEESRNWKEDGTVKNIYITGLF